MTHRRDFLYDYKELDSNSVVLENDQGLPIRGKGTVNIKKSIDNEWYDSTITNVLYILNLKKFIFRGDFDQQRDENH